MKNVLIATTLFLSFYANASPMDDLLTCTDNCPYTVDLYNSDKTFAAELSANLKSIGLEGAYSDDGYLNGVESQVNSYSNGKNTILVGSVCGSDCFTFMKYLYDLSTLKMKSVLVDGGEVTLMGNPSQDMVIFLLKDEGVTIPKVPTATAERNDIPADTIWSLKDNNGRVLWDVCGGTQSSCAIVLSTTHMVAVVNRRSTSGCTLGEFYVVAKTENFWQQYDPGTCSTNAFFRVGTMNRGQYRTVDVILQGELVKQFPIEYWSMQKEFSGKNRPKWKDKSELK